jgi:hypothetical protein
MMLSSDAEAGKLRGERDSRLIDLPPEALYRTMTEASGSSFLSSLPLLEEIYAKWTAVARTDNAQISRRVREAALINELSPDNAARLISAEIRLQI